MQLLFGGLWDVDAVRYWISQECAKRNNRLNDEWNRHAIIVFAHIVKKERPFWNDWIRTQCLCCVLYRIRFVSSRLCAVWIAVLYRAVRNTQCNAMLIYRHFSHFSVRLVEHFVVCVFFLHSNNVHITAIRWSERTREYRSVCEKERGTPSQSQ